MTVLNFQGIVVSFSGSYELWRNFDYSLFLLPKRAIFPSWRGLRGEYYFYKVDITTYQNAWTQAQACTFIIIIIIIIIIIVIVIQHVYFVLANALCI